jgi:hypothetical protein
VHRASRSNAWDQSCREYEASARQYGQTASSRVPEAGLEFIDRLIGEQAQWPPGDLKDCLEAIQAGSPDHVFDNRFEGLSLYLRKHT